MLSLLRCVTDFRTRLCGHSCVYCVGAAERGRLAGSRHLVWDTAQRALSFWQTNPTRCFNDHASLHILPLVLPGFYSAYLYLQDSAHCEDDFSPDVSDTVVLLLLTCSRVFDVFVT